MIRLFVLCLMAIVSALWITLYLGFPADPGYLLLAFGNYTFETSLFALLVAGILLYTAFRFLLVIFHWINPMHLLTAGRKLNSQRKARARSHFVEGMLFLARGNWKSSLKILKKAMADRNTSSITYLAAAFAAQQLGQKDTWVDLLDQAEQRFPIERSTINYFKAKLYFQSGQLQQSLSMLEKLKQQAINDSSLLRLLKEVYVQLADWQHLEQLLPGLEKNQVLNEEELEDVKKHILMEKLTALCNLARKDNSEALAELKKLWRKTPTSFHEDEQLVCHYTELLLQLNENQDAAKVVEFAISKNWNPGLVKLYGAREYGSSMSQLMVAERWLNENPADAVLLLSLGRICMRNQLWGRAREYFEASIKVVPSADAYGELARLLKNLGEHQASEACFRNYGDLMGASLPELPMPDSELANIRTQSLS